MKEFEELVGFSDRDLGYDGAKARLRYSNGTVASTENGKEFGAGKLDVVSLAELRRMVDAENETGPNIYVHTEAREECVKNYLLSPEYSGALFQVASQFNLLEMGHPSFIPEDGVEIYWGDPTQGPACAQAAIGATLYRNYFIQMPDGTRGQSKDNQINCLEAVLKWLKDKKPFVWNYQNGYVFIDSPNFSIINDVLSTITDAERDELRGLLEIGIQWNVQINDERRALKQFVTQIFSSAFPVRYNDIGQEKARQLSELILEATEEATIIAGILNKQRTGSGKIVLTKVGGGAFGNSHEWVANAIQRALRKYQNYGLEILQYHYRDKESFYEDIKP